MRNLYALLATFLVVLFSSGLVMPVYGGCPASPELFCQYYHPGSIMTGLCYYSDCFDMSYGEEARLVAADEEGLFPKTWKVWHSGTLSPEPDSIQCEVETSGNKSKVTFPGESVVCAVNLYTSEHVYHWHFASNPASECLGWVECQEP